MTLRLPLNVRVGGLWEFVGKYDFGEGNGGYTDRVHINFNAWKTLSAIAVFEKGRNDEKDKAQQEREWQEHDHYKV